jgi:hypothetical protein
MRGYTKKQVREMLELRKMYNNLSDIEEQKAEYYNSIGDIENRNKHLYKSCYYMERVIEIDDKLYY